jgi:hypothetical protein
MIIMSLASKILLKKVLCMGCNRSDNVLGTGNRRRKCHRDENVLGVQEIALRGPGCISGTGECEEVGGAGRRRKRFINRSNVLGTGEMRDCFEDFCCCDLITPITVPR